MTIITAGYQGYRFRMSLNAPSLELSADMGGAQVQLGIGTNGVLGAGLPDRARAPQGGIELHLAEVQC